MILSQQSCISWTGGRTEGFLGLQVARGRTQWVQSLDPDGWLVRYTRNHQRELKCEGYWFTRNKRYAHWRARGFGYAIDTERLMGDPKDLLINLPAQAW